MFFRRFANLQALKSVSKANLLELLSRPATKEYLAGRSLLLPADSANELLDAVPLGMLRTSEVDPTPADVALQLVLKDRKFLEQKRAEQFLHRSRAFRVCQGSGRKKKLPRWTERSERLIASALGRWFAEHGRGGEPRLSVFPRPEEGQLWILVQRGAARRIQGTYDEGKPSSLTFRPQAFDLVVYHVQEDILVIHTDTDTKGERDLYRRQIGLHLFGNQDYFAPEGNTTLTPLMERGRTALDCDGLVGIEWVRLRELEVYRGARRGMFVRVKSDDVFADIEDSQMILPKGFPTKAVFAVKFADAKEPRTITKYAPSRDRYERDDDRAAMEPFFLKNGYHLNARRTTAVD
jgi:hypothetical protein